MLNLYEILAPNVCIPEGQRQGPAHSLHIAVEQWGKLEKNESSAAGGGADRPRQGCAARDGLQLRLET